MTVLMRGRVCINCCLALALLFFTASSSVMAGTSIDGVTLEQRISDSGGTLFLNGAGIRKKLFIKLYVGSLYVEEDSLGADAPSLVQADAPMLIQLDILSSLLTRDKLVKAINDGFRKSTGGNTQSIQSGITAMSDALDQPLNPGDVYRIAYTPDVGTRIVRGEQLLATIPGLPFKQAAFGIWLSDDPAQASLKKAMLSQ